MLYGFIAIILFLGGLFSGDINIIKVSALFAIAHSVIDISSTLEYNLKNFKK